MLICNIVVREEPIELERVQGGCLLQTRMMDGFDINKQRMNDEVCSGSKDNEFSVEPVGLSINDDEEEVSQYDIEDLMCDKR